MVEWTKKGKTYVGVQKVGSVEFDWKITKSPGGMAYKLYMGKVPMITKATIEECKEYAENFL